MVIGIFKNETPNKQIINFIGLCNKLYSYKTEDEYTRKVQHKKLHKKCKGRS